MSGRPFIDGAFRTIKGGTVWLNSTPRKVTRGQAFINGAWRNLVSFASPLSLYISPDSISGSVTANSLQTVYSDAATAVVAGGVAPFSYAWSVLSGGAALTSPASAITSVSKTLGVNSSATGTIRCTCTDAVGATVTADGFYELSNYKN